MEQNNQDSTGPIAVDLAAEFDIRYASIRNLVRVCYAFQDLRVQTGNRVCAAFRDRAGATNKPKIETKPEDKEAQVAKMLDLLKKDYRRVTDGIVAEGDAVLKKIDDEELRNSKLPSQKRFEPTGMLESYSDLLLVDNYISILGIELDAFKNLEKALKGIPIYDEFLSTVDGIGPALAGVILSEINIAKAEYPSSLHAYAGLDVVPVGIYNDEKGKEHTVPAWQIDEFYGAHDVDVEFLAEGRYPVHYEMRGRSNKEWALVFREYKAADGTIKTRRSITYNPWLKTKLVGVMIGSFLKRNSVTVDGKRMSKKDRLALAINEGLELNDDDDTDKQVIDWLCQNHAVDRLMSPYAKAYYGYRMRLDNRERVAVSALEHEFIYNPTYKDWADEDKQAYIKTKRKSENHKHRMACRYAAKIFLNDLYRVWRRLEGLPVAPTYEEAKLGKVHGQAGVMGTPEPRFFRPEFERTHQPCPEDVSEL